MKHAEKIDAIKKSKPMRVSDIIYLSALAVIIGLLMVLVYWRPWAAQGDWVVISVRGSQNRYYSLSENRVLDIEGHLTVNIQNGAVSITHSTCPDRICVHSGHISRVHQILVCAPHGVTIRITGESDLHGIAR